MADRDAIIRKQILSLTDRKDFGIFSPPMDAQTALNELCRHFLGSDWYTVNPISTRQVNTEIVYEIERHYKGNKKEWRRLVKAAQREEGQDDGKRPDNGL